MIGSKETTTTNTTTLAGGATAALFANQAVPEAYWVAWLLLGFGIPEVIALFTKKEGDTLSENVRKWFATDEAGRQATTQLGKVRRITLVTGLAWLVLHWLNTGTYF